MDNRDAAGLFSEIADLLEIQGANPFKVRAYRNAADVVGTLPEPASGLSQEELLALPGIGREIAAKLGEIFETGRLRYREALLAELPASLLDLLHLAGARPEDGRPAVSPVGGRRRWSNSRPPPRRAGCAHCAGWGRAGKRRS